MSGDGLMKKDPREKQIPCAMAPACAGNCQRCRKKSDMLWPLYYPRTNSAKENVWEVCPDCRESLGYGTKWEYAGGGDVVALEPKVK